MQHINENIEEIKQHLLDDNMVVKKGTDRLTVKIFPTMYSNSYHDTDNTHNNNGALEH